jgi:hypothetical protein
LKITSDIDFDNHTLLSLKNRGCMSQLRMSYLRSKSHDSSVGIALGYGLDDRGFRIQFQARAGNFSLRHHIHNGSGAHPASHPMGTRGSFPEGKVAGA